MPTFFFRVRTPDQMTRRAESFELPDLNAALIQAQRSARSLVRTPARRGIMTMKGSLDIENELNQPLARLTLAEVAHQIS